MKASKNRRPYFPIKQLTRQNLQRPQTPGNHCQKCLSLGNLRSSLTSRVIPASHREPSHACSTALFLPRSHDCQQRSYFCCWCWSILSRIGHAFHYHNHEDNDAVDSTSQAQTGIDLRVVHPSQGCAYEWERTATRRTLRCACVQLLRMLLGVSMCACKHAMPYTRCFADCSCGRASESARACVGARVRATPQSALTHLFTQAHASQHEAVWPSSRSIAQLELRKSIWCLGLAAISDASQLPLPIALVDASN